MFTAWKLAAQQPQHYKPHSTSTPRCSYKASSRLRKQQRSWNSSCSSSSRSLWLLKQQYLTKPLRQLLLLLLLRAGLLGTAAAAAVVAGLRVVVQQQQGHQHCARCALQTPPHPLHSLFK
jgi:hypothetical protein